MFGRSKEQGPLTGVNLLDLAPVRLASWHDDGERIVVERPRPRGKGLAFINSWLGYQTAPRMIRLDPVGSFAWQRLDGKTTVAEVAAALREEFGEAVEPTEERLGTLVKVMHREALIAYPGLEEVPPTATTARRLENPPPEAAGGG